MYGSKRTVCDATTEDLRGLKALFARDPRLLSHFDFAVAYRIARDCDAQGSALYTDQIADRSDGDSQRCNVQPHTSVLLAAAVMLMVSIPPGADESDRPAEWRGSCRGVKGIYFMSEHCRNVQSNAKEVHSAYSSAVCPFVRPKEFGIEDSLCPVASDYWKPR